MFKFQWEAFGSQQRMCMCFCSHGMAAIWLVLYVLGSARTLFAEVFGLDQSSRLQRLPKRAMADQQAAIVTDEL